MQIILSIHFFFLERFVSINLMNHITKLMLMAKRGTLSSVITLCYLYFQLNQNGILEA